VAQSCFESNDFTSRVFLETNNCIGYKFVAGAKWQAGKSPHVSTEMDYYAKYTCVENCAGELAGWISRRANVFKFVTTIAEYVHALSVFTYYGCPESQYLKGCLRYFRADSL